MTPASAADRPDIHPGGPAEGLRALGATTRLHRWWKPKATNLLGVLYAVVLVTGLPFTTALTLLLPAVITIVGIGSFGHLVNDWFDIEADARAGKPNRFSSLPATQRYGLLLAAVVAAAIPWLVLPFDAFSGALLGFEIALLLAYVLPPVRLKDRKVWPVFADGAYAYGVPAVLAAHTFFLAAGQRSNAALLVPLFLYQLALGIRHFLNHLALDRQNDLASGTSTVATRRGNAFIHGVIRRVVLPAELTALAVYLLVVSRGRPVLIVVAAALVLMTTALHAVLTVGRAYPLIPYRFSHSHADRLHQDILPLLLLAWLVATDWRFVLLLGVHVLLFYPIVPVAIARVRRQRPRQDDAAPAVPAVIPADRQTALPIALTSAPIRRAEISIAVANINKGKYTETFVDELIPALPYRVLQLHGGELPQYDADDRHFLSNWPSLQAVAHAAQAVLGLDQRHFLRNSIASYLQAQDVRLVLAHFAPVAVEMLPITRDLGIPLIAYFHGYDVFHDQTRRRWATARATLFREAAALIGVSERMVARLEELGAPRQKLVHLPAFVNLRLFPCTDRSRSPANYLAVGRFAETKSPHLTILAFQRVAHTVPEATLTMIGKGGGGELFEACVILVKALGLEDRVTFMGVLSHEEVAREMRRARVFVQHSVTTPEHGDMEGKPVAVMEAMASGLPVVATRHSGIVELVEHGVTGLLVDEFDVTAMADAMIRLAHDDDLVGRMGRAASAAIHEHPLIRRHVAILEDVIDRAIANG